MALSDADLSSLLSLLKFDSRHKAEVFKAHGRNYYVPLQQPVPPHDTLQISGGGDFDLGVSHNVGQALTISAKGVIRPPSSDSGIHTHTYQTVENDEIKSVAETSPKGSYNLQGALRKIERTKTAAEIFDGSAIIIPGVAGHFRYSGIYDEYGEQQAAVVFAVPYKGVRTDSQILRISPTLALRLSGADIQVPEEEIERAISFVSLACELGGNALQMIHAKDLAHQEPTIGNSLPLRSNDMDFLFVTDWETAVKLVGRTAREVSLLKSKDLVVLYSSAVQFLDLLRDRQLLAVATHTRHRNEFISLTLQAYGFSVDSINGMEIYPDEPPLAAVYAIAKALE